MKDLPYYYTLLLCYLAALFLVIWLWDKHQRNKEERADQRWKEAELKRHRKMYRKAQEKTNHNEK